MRENRGTKVDKGKRSRYEGLGVMLLFIGFGVFMVGRGIYSSINTRNLIRDGYEVVAITTSVNIHRGGANSNYSIDIEYEIEGVIYNNRIYVRGVRERYEGQEIMIYYSPRNPNNIILSDVDRMLDTTQGFPMIIGAVLAITVSYLLIKGPEKKRSSNVDLE